MISVHNKFSLQQIVFLKTDDEQKERMVYSIEICPNNQLLYRLMCGTHSSSHYDFEISEERKPLSNSVTGFHGTNAR